MMIIDHDDWSNMMMMIDHDYDDDYDDDDDVRS